MRNFETPYIADWFAALLRWFVLVVLSIFLSVRGLSNALFWVLILMLLWNVGMSSMAGLSVRLQRYHRQIVLGVDFLLAVLLFLAQGGLASATIWVALIPIGVGAIYFEMWGAFITAGVFALLQAAISREMLSDIFAFSGLTVTLLIGLTSGLIGRLAMRRMRTSRHTLLHEYTTLL